MGKDIPFDDNNLLFYAFNKWRKSDKVKRDEEWLDYICLRDKKNYRKKTSDDRYVEVLSTSDYEIIKSRVYENVILYY